MARGEWSPRVGFGDYLLGTCDCIPLGPAVFLFTWLFAMGEIAGKLDEFRRIFSTGESYLRGLWS